MTRRFTLRIHKILTDMRICGTYIWLLVSFGGVVMCEDVPEEQPNDNISDDIEELREKLPPYIAHLGLGEVEGSKDISSNGKTFYSFQGIPYAEAPTENLRFQNPVALASFEGLVDGRNPSPPCSQINVMEFIKNGEALYEGQEDCLTLDIYTPEYDEDLSDLPVMVFFPGSSYASGDSSSFDPHDLMNHDIVLVVIQYRLGVLGFLSTEDSVISGNFGLKDQTLALKWINKYIDRFGGNNLRVTLFGQGSGSSSVHFQMLSHHTIGLFQRAILQSGNAMCPWALGGVHREAASYIGNQFNCTMTVETDELVEEEDSNVVKHRKLFECLKNTDAKELTLMLPKFYVWGNLPTIFGPYVDGRYIPDTPEFLLKESRHKKIDIIVGTVKDEGSFYVNSMFANEGHRISLKYDFPNIAPVSMEFTTDDIAPVNMSIKAYDFYVGGLKIDASDAYNLSKLYGDRHQTVCSDQLALMHSRNLLTTKKKVFKYELQYRGSQSNGDAFDLMFGREWVSHGDDVMYIFPAKKQEEIDRTEEDILVSNILTKLWVNFASTGNPTPGDDLGFEWLPFTEDSPSHIAITNEPFMEEDKRAEVREFWTSLPTKQNLYLYPSKFGTILKQLEEAKQNVMENASSTEEDSVKDTQNNGALDVQINNNVNGSDNITPNEPLAVEIEDEQKSQENDDIVNGILAESTTESPQKDEL